MSWPWSQLGLPGPSELPEIRRAYAEKLKITHPEDDPEGFQRLHSAYQLASRMARQRKRTGGGPEPRTEYPSPPPREETTRTEGERPRSGEDFDFDRLLEDGDEPPRRPRGEDGEPELDFDRLLEDGDEPARPPRDPEEERDWDYERLFAEGEAERAEERRRRGEERRRAQAQARANARERQRAREWTQKREYWQRQEQQNTYDRERRERFSQEELRWQNTETILHTLEMLYNARAPMEEWKKFFAGPLFQQNKGSLDLIFGLEDFVSTRDLTQEVRLALFLAYGFDKGVSRPELRPLHQMLLPAWKIHKKTDRFRASSMLWGFGGAVVFLLVLGPILEFGILSTVLVALGAGWIVWALREVVRLGSIEKRARGQTVDRKQERLTMARVILAVAAVVIVLSLSRGVELSGGLKQFLPTKDPREQTCRYIKQDFGVEVASLYNQYPLEDNGNIFYLKSDTSKSFLAGPNGERDGENTGYTTNLPEMMLFWELKEFARAHDMSPVNALDQGLGREAVSGIFLITLPEEEGEEIIEDLGKLLEELSQEKWYDALPDQCELVLCSRELERGRIVLIRVHPATEVYSVPQIQGLYEYAFAHSVYAQILRELELDRDFLRGEGEDYTLTNEGTAMMRGNECIKLFGLNENGAVAMEYYVYPKLRNIYCVPGNFWETGNSETQINFYRLLHWGDRGTFNLFYPWMKVD